MLQDPLLPPPMAPRVVSKRMGTDVPAFVTSPMHGCRVTAPWGAADPPRPPKLSHSCQQTPNLRPRRPAQAFAEQSGGIKNIPKYP